MNATVLLTVFRTSLSEEVEVEEEEEEAEEEEEKEEEERKENILAIWRLSGSVLL